MKALILNSGTGSRMGKLSDSLPKCLMEIGKQETILSRQLKLLESNGVTDVIITTGKYDKLLRHYCESLTTQLNFTFVNNHLYDQTNYIYSIYLAEEFVHDDIILLHGDLVFDQEILKDLVRQKKSSMTISSTEELPEKDFKAVVKDNRIYEISIHSFDDAVTAQPLYKILHKDWELWLQEIIFLCDSGEVDCYAENAFNRISEKCKLHTMDFREQLCAEVDTPEDLQNIKERLAAIS